MSTSNPDLVRVGATPGPVEYLRSMWRRREFAIAIPTAELHAQHRNTALGNLWHLLNPVMQVGVYYLIFGVLIDATRGVENLIGFLTIGVFAFHFTAKSVNAGAKSITSNEGLMRAISFPRAILPLSVVVSEFLAFGYSLITMVAIVLLTGEALSWTWLFFIPAVLLQALFNIGIALFVARLAAKFRDVQQVLPFIVRVWFYLSGVIWPTVRLVEELPQFHFLLYFNPAYVYLELMRYSLMGHYLDESMYPAPPGLPVLDGTLWGAAVAWAVVSAVVGFFFFRAGENEYGRV